MAKTPKEKIASGVTEAINKANKVRTTPKLARLARLPGNQKDLTELVAYARKVRNRLHKMRADTAVAFAKITEQKTEEYKRWGMTPGDKEGMWTDEFGVDRRIVARSRSIDRAQKAHARSTVNERDTLLSTMRAVVKDLDRAEPLFNSTVAMLLRQTMGDGKRAQYMRILQGAGPVAIMNATLDCIIGQGDGVPNKALGAALVTLIEQSETLQDAVTYSRQDIADALVGDDYWAAFESLGMIRYFREQCEVAVMEMSGDGASIDRKKRAGIMKEELQTATLKLFNEAGDTVDAEGNVIKAAEAKPASDDYYDQLLAESRAKDAAVVKEKRRQAAKARQDAEDDVARIINRTEAEENALYGGAK